MSPALFAEDSVAQLVEQYTFNVWVLGSSPSGITDKTLKPASTMDLRVFHLKSLSVPLADFISPF